MHLSTAPRILQQRLHLTTPQLNWNCLIKWWVFEISICVLVCFGPLFILSLPFCLTSFLLTSSSSHPSSSHPSSSHPSLTASHPSLSASHPSSSHPSSSPPSSSHPSSCPHSLTDGATSSGGGRVSFKYSTTQCLCTNGAQDYTAGCTDLPQGPR